MANDVTGNPLIIDTASATVVWRNNLKVAAFSWTEYVADAHEIVVKDRNGREIWRVNGNADLSPVHNESIGWVQGLAVTTLNSGKLRVFLA